MDRPSTLVPAAELAARNKATRATSAGVMSGLAPGRPMASISVSTDPGQIALTAMPWGRSSSARADHLWLHTSKRSASGQACGSRCTIHGLMITSAPGGTSTPASTSASRERRVMSHAGG